MMRVCIAGVLPSSQRSGGVETVVSELAAELATRPGLKVEVLSMREGNKLWGITTHILESSFSLLSILKAWWFLKSSNYDIVHAHIPAAGIASVLAGKKTVYTFHSIPLLEEERSLLAKVGHIFEHILLKIISRRAKVTVVCNYLKKAVRQFYGVEATTIYNGLNEKNYTFPRLKRMGENILFVGRVVPRKGVDYLVGAMNEIVKKDPGIKLHIVGGGYYLEHIQKIINKLSLGNNIIIYQNVSREKLMQLYALSDILVVPSTYDIFPTVILEGILAGLPIVGTSVGGIPEMIDGNGVLVPPRNVGELAGALIKLLDSPEKRTQFLNKSKILAKRFTVKKQADQFLQVYKTIGGMG